MNIRDQVDIENLEKVVLTQEGHSLSPVTTGDVVFDIPSGKSVEDLIENLKNTSTNVILTKTLVLEAKYEGQFIFPIEYPIEGYDIEKFPIVVLRAIDGNIQEIKRDEYLINSNEDTDDQLIFNTAKQQPFYKGENCVLIFHYSTTIHNGSNVNADTINNTFVIFGSPEEGVDYPDNTVFFDFQNQYIYYFNNGTKHSIKIGATEIETYTKTITSNTQSVQIDAPGYNSAEDDLIIYENGIVIDRDEYYTIDDQLVMRKINNIIWEASLAAPITFSFVIYKNARTQPAGTNGSSVIVVPDNSISADKLSPELKTYIEEVTEAAKDLEGINKAINIKVDPISAEGQVDSTTLQATIEGIYGRLRTIESKINELTSII